MKGSKEKKATKGALLSEMAIYQYDRQTKQYSVKKDPSNLLPRKDRSSRKSPSNEVESWVRKGYPLRDNDCGSGYSLLLAEPVVEESGLNEWQVKIQIT